MITGFCALVVGACGQETSTVESEAGTRLIVYPTDTAEGMFGKVSGTLGVNDQGCFVLDDFVLVVGKGSTILPGAEAIDVADVGNIKVGAQASGGGGLIEGKDEVETFADAIGFDDAVWDCQSDQAAPALIVLDPSGR